MQATTDTLYMMLRIIAREYNGVLLPASKPLGRVKIPVTRDQVRSGIKVFLSAPGNHQQVRLLLRLQAHRLFGIKRMLD